MDHCPNCGSELNIDEKAAGRCFTCNSVFESILPGDKKNGTQRIVYSNNNKNPNYDERLSNHISKNNAEHELHEAVKQIARDIRFLRNLVIGFIIASIVFAVVYYNIYMKPLIELSKNL